MAGQESGIALLFEPDVRDLLVGLAVGLRPHGLMGPSLGAAVNPPHVELFRGAFKESFDVTGVLANVRVPIGSWRFGVAHYEPGGWLQLRVRGSWLKDAHAAVFGHCRELVSPGLGLAGRTGGEIPPVELVNRATWGYRYVGKSFRAHVTLGRCNGPADELVRVANEQVGRFELGTHGPVALSAYTGAYHGMHGRTLARVELVAARV